MKNLAKITPIVLIAGLMAYCGSQSKFSETSLEDTDIIENAISEGPTGDEGESKTVLPSISIIPNESIANPVNTITLPEKNHSAFFWKGFQHEWLRTFMGFRLPHRISKFDSYINNEDHDKEGSWVGDATFTFGQSTGVDGNYMKPKGYYGAANSAGIYVSRGNVSLSWTDNGSGGTYPKAQSVITEPISIDLSKDKLGNGNLDNYIAFLRGIKLDSNCDNAKQPASTPCNSDGMWPYKMYVKIHGCAKSGTTLNCTLTAIIKRAWTPNKGGLPPFEEKPFNDKLDFDLQVYYTVMGGNNGSFRYSHGSEFTTSGKGRDNNAKSGTKTIYGPAGYATGTTVLTAFGFEFTKFGSAAKNNHLGRYIGKMYFRVKDNSYSSSTGDISYTYYQQVWVPDTVVNTNVTYYTKAALLQFDEVGSTVVKNKSVDGSLCINSNGAPWFSKWQKCNSGDKGPARSEHKVQIYAP